MEGISMGVGNPTAEGVLYSSRRAADLSALQEDALIRASDEARGSNRKLLVRMVRSDAETIATAITARLHPDARLGFPLNIVGDAGSEFAKLSDDPRGARPFPVLLLYCALHVVKPELQAGSPIERAIDAMEITEADERLSLPAWSAQL
jgi:hypothetical protein